jgi:hypothetical protein
MADEVTGPRCDTCRYWQRYRPNSDEAGSGECRRYPPAVVLVELAEFEGSKSSGFNAMNGSEWPQTGPAGWCGEHQAPAAAGDVVNLPWVNRKRADVGLPPLTSEDLVRR